MSVYQPTPRRSAAKGAALSRRLTANPTLSPSLANATVEMEGETREFIRRDSKHGVLFFVRSTANATRYYTISYVDGKYECSTTDETTAKRLLSRLQAWLKSQAEAVAAQAEYLNEQKLAQYRAGNAYEVEGPCKQTTDRCPKLCPFCEIAELEKGCEMCADCWRAFYKRC